MYPPFTRPRTEMVLAYTFICPSVGLLVVKMIHKYRSAEDKPIAGYSCRKA